jgi:hypothetical protein
MAITTMFPPINQPIVEQAIGAPRPTFYKNRQQEQQSKPVPVDAAKQAKKAVSTNTAAGICHRYPYPPSSKMLTPHKAAIF